MQALKPNFRSRFYANCFLLHLQVIRDMIADMGTPGSLPKDDKDVIDMMSVLQELTFSAAERRGMFEAMNYI